MVLHPVEDLRLERTVIIIHLNIDPVGTPDYKCQQLTRSISPEVDAVGKILKRFQVAGGKDPVLGQGKPPVERLQVPRVALYKESPQFFDLGFGVGVVCLVKFHYASCKFRRMMLTVWALFPNCRGSVTRTNSNPALLQN